MEKSQSPSPAGAWRSDRGVGRMASARSSSIRNRVYSLLQTDSPKHRIGRLLDGLIIGLVVVNTAFIILDTFSLPPPYEHISAAAETVCACFFTVEYLLRFWTAPCVFPREAPGRSRLHYLTTPMALVDLLSILPFYLPLFLPVDLTVLKILRVLRLLRLLKFNRYTSGIHIIRDVFRRKAGQLLSSCFVVFLLMVVAAVMMYYVENAAQPDKFDNAFSALWWAMETLTTVGYGDVYPVTAVGKILSGGIALLGIGLVAVPTGIISAGIMESIEQQKKESASGKHYCPYCGKRIDP